jgi:hypothetical protein
MFYFIPEEQLPDLLFILPPPCLANGQPVVSPLQPFPPQFRHASGTIFLGHHSLMVQSNLKVGIEWFE